MFEALLWFTSWHDRENQVVRHQPSGRQMWFGLIWVFVSAVSHSDSVFCFLYSVQCTLHAAFWISASVWQCDSVILLYIYILSQCQASGVRSQYLIRIIIIISLIMWLPWAMSTMWCDFTGNVDHFSILTVDPPGPIQSSFFSDVPSSHWPSLSVERGQWKRRANLCHRHRHLLRLLPLQKPLHPRFRQRSHWWPFFQDRLYANAVDALPNSSTKCDLSIYYH